MFRVHVCMYACKFVWSCGLVCTSKCVHFCAIIVIDLATYLLTISLPDVSISLYEASH